MRRDQAHSLLVEAISEILKQSGREYKPLRDDIKPFQDLEGFDSLNGEEVTALLLDEINFDEEFNPFISDEGKELTLGEIATRLSSFSIREEEQANV